MQEQPFKPEHRDYFNKQQRGHSGLPHCPFCGTGYVTPVAPPVSTDFEGLVTDQNGTDVHQYKQAFKCTKPWCRTEFDVVYRAMYAEHVVVPLSLIHILGSTVELRRQTDGGRKGENIVGSYHLPKQGC